MLGPMPGVRRMRYLAHGLAVAAVFAVVVNTTGCAVRRETMTVAVRDGLTGAPVGGARVAVRPLFLFRPASDEKPKSATFNPNAERHGDTTEGTTDADGLVRIEGTVTHAMQITIIAPGYAPLRFTADRHPARSGVADRWFGEEPEAQLTPTPSMKAQLRN